MRKKIIRSFSRWTIIIKLRKKYANQLKRESSLSINLLEGNNDQARVVNSRYLISQGIEPTADNLQKLQKEINEEIMEWHKEHPNEPKREIPIPIHSQQPVEEEKFRITLRAARVNRGLTLKNVAAIIGKSARTIGKYEIDSSNISINLALELSNLYMVSLDILYFGPENIVTGLTRRKMAV